MSTWPDARAPHMLPPREVDVLCWRGYPELAADEHHGWDIAYVDRRGHWCTATLGGRQITDVMRWWPMPERQEDHP